MTTFSLDFPHNSPPILKWIIQHHSFSNSSHKQSFFFSFLSSLSPLISSITSYSTRFSTSFSFLNPILPFNVLLSSPFPPLIIKSFSLLLSLPLSSPFLFFSVFALSIGVCRKDGSWTQNRGRYFTTTSGGKVRRNLMFYQSSLHSFSTTNNFIPFPCSSLHSLSDFFFLLSLQS